MKTKIIKAIEKNKIIVIVRSVPKTHIMKTAEAMYNGGIRLMEITFDQTNYESNIETAEMISMLKNQYGDKLSVGAGTVLTEKQLDMAHKAGAEYIISPDTNGDIIAKTNKLGMVSIPGALTPTEIRRAHDYGADFVKIFPITAFGDTYIKDISAPLNHIKLLAVGGINADNFQKYLLQGALGVGIGGNIANKDLILSGKFEEISDLAKKYTSQLEQGETSI